MNLRFLADQLASAVLRRCLSECLFRFLSNLFVEKVHALSNDVCSIFLVLLCAAFHSNVQARACSSQVGSDTIRNASAGADAFVPREALRPLLASQRAYTDRANW